MLSLCAAAGLAPQPQLHLFTPHPTHELVAHDLRAQAPMAMQPRSLCGLSAAPMITLHEPARVVFFLPSNLSNPWTMPCRKKCDAVCMIPVGFFGGRVDFSYRRWLAKHPKLAHAPLVAERDPQDMQNVPRNAQESARRTEARPDELPRGGAGHAARVAPVVGVAKKNRKVGSSRDGRRDIDLHVLGPRMKPSGSVIAQHVCCSGRRVGHLVSCF